MTLVEAGWAQARAHAHAAAGLGPLGREQVAIADALNRVLAEPVHARTPLPAHDASAMDGWAVCGDGPWRLRGAVLAGMQADTALSPGHAVVIATGAAVPTGTTGVLRSEDGTIDADGLLHGNVIPGQDIRPSGEEATAGEELIAAGTRLGPVHLGLAAAAGHDTLLVARRPRARVLVFGDELLHAGPARDGRVRDSLGPQLPAWLTSLGLELLDVRWVEDTLQAHTEALAACTDVDLVITTGGTAAGPVDHLHAALAATGGTLVVDTVACRPGHPMLLGTWGDRWLVGLPGNPQAAIVALLSLGQPLVEALLGRPLPALGRVTLARAERTRGATTRLVPCTLDGHLATPVPHIGSGMLRGLAAADGFAVITPGGIAAEGQADWLPLPY